MKAKLLFTLLFSVGIISFASAQSGQRDRDRDGLRSGEVTRREAYKIRRDKLELRHDYRDAKRDGVISRHERKHLKRERKMHHRKVHRMKHNRHDRF